MGETGKIGTASTETCKLLRSTVLRSNEELWESVENRGNWEGEKRKQGEDRKVEKKRKKKEY